MTLAKLSHRSHYNFTCHVATQISHTSIAYLAWLDNVQIQEMTVTLLQVFVLF